MIESKVVNWGPKPFRSSNAWLSHPEFKAFVDEKWKSYQVEGWAGYVIKEKLKKLKEDFRVWSREIFGNLDKRIEDRKEEIWKLDVIDDALGLTEEEVLKTSFERAMLLCEIKQRKRFLNQKAKRNWVTQGDMNTAAFHRVIKGQRKSNEIRGLYVQGVWSQEVRTVKEEIHNSFKAHFTKTTRRRPNIDENFVFKHVSNEDNSFLVRPFTEQEIKEAMDSCNETKSPGPDGMNIAVFRHCWDSFKEDFLRFFKEFHVNGVLPKGLNHSFVTLIQKAEISKDIKDFRPISLIGSTYKILSKVLAKRLSCILPSIISEEQFAFVGGRQISECIVSLQGILEDVKERKDECICYKIDFSKAYDSIEWSFLEDIMKAFGFDSKWIKWIMSCVGSAHIDVLVNGSPSGDFGLERGVRQGDPLSPFLFIMVADCISNFMRKAMALGLFDPVKVGDGSVRVSHLQYADDTIFVGKTSVKNALFLKRMLILLEWVSGLKINPAKCSVIGVNTEEGALADIAAVLGCKISSLPIKYLGIKVGCSHKRVRDWNYVVDKIKSRIQNGRVLIFQWAGE